MAKLAMARSLAHKGLTDMKRRDDDEYFIIVPEARTQHPNLGECLVGKRLEGIGAFHVHFPVDAVRVASLKEVEFYTTKVKVGRSYAPSYHLRPADFMTQEDIDGLPRQDWRDFA